MNDFHTAGMLPFQLSGFAGSDRNKGVISFAGYLPISEMLGLEAIREARDQLQAGYCPGVGPDDAMAGKVSLREQLLRRMVRSVGTMKVPEPGQMLWLSSPRTALNAVIRIIAKPGDTVLVEALTSAESLGLFKTHGLQAVAASSEHEGISIDSARTQIKARRPRFIYTMPTYGSPDGRLWNQARREELLELAREFDIPVVEDDTYSGLNFGDVVEDGKLMKQESARPIPSLLELDGDIKAGRVIYIGGIPSLSADEFGWPTGWITANSELIGKILEAKQTVDSGARPTVSEAELSRLSQVLPLEVMEAALAAACRARLARMKRLLTKYMPATRWTEPRGGLFLWVELPEGLDAEALQRASALQGVAIQPGAGCYASEARRNTARLNFCGMKEEEMEEGIRRLAEAADAFTARSI
ncbi:PLP-dependent aminotransferase family protein [Paenibacillus sp. GCM10012307]|uniref:PLP-dependent aminotransferase family protein n=1 Tax=Paenibacillus roseus TaxID=2798579 RepID=A0A934IZP9_9BACL|nr:PLP-dependent aminotransferase family protein [Paenibacillus roseus]MBJ6362192.1 PLP-dependent aminotransferase family protein [Paenibacillus roseus]